MPESGAAPARQRGWAGLVVLLLAVLIVALLAGTMLKHYGAPAAPPARATGPATGAGRVETEGAVPAPGNAVVRARGLEETVRQQAADLERRIDDAAR
jgi:hypothetical protein